MDEQNNKLLNQAKRLLSNITGLNRTDVLFECYVALLINMQKNVNEDETLKYIHILPTDSPKRSYRHDIITDEKYPQINKYDYLEIRNSRNSLTDYLPEAFFAIPYKDENSDIEEHIQSAKTFFRPLEIEYNTIRVKKELKETELLRNYHELLTHFWNGEIAADSDNKAKFPIETAEDKRFLNTLHLIPLFIGDERKTTKMIEYVLDKKVTLKFNIEEKTALPNEHSACISSDTKKQYMLGDNLYLNSVIYHYTQICTVAISDIPKKEMYSYLNDEVEIIRRIKDYYFPLDIEVRFAYKMLENKAGKATLFKVELDEREGEGLLGYSTRL